MNPFPFGSPESASLGRPELEDPDAWQLWWNFNHDPLLSLDRWIDERDRESGEDARARRSKLKQAFGESALPELRKILVEGGPVPVVRDCLLSVARVSDGEIRTKIDLEHYARFFLATPNAELRMASILALGIQGDPLAVPLLSSLLRHDSQAREVVEGPVTDRDRALAAFALGMIGHECAWPEMRREIAQALVATIEDASWQVGVACVLGLGQIPLDSCHGVSDLEASEGGHVCPTTILSLLTTLSLAEEEHSWLRAHAACAAGRLAADAPSDVRSQVAEVLFYFLDPRACGDAEIRLGSVIGLGLLARGGTDPIDVRAREKLFAATEDGDDMTRSFACVALAEMASRFGLPTKEEAALRDLLAGELGRGRKERSGWAALALGILGHQTDGRANDSDVRIPGLLRDAVEGARSPSEAAAAALALGLVGDRSEETRESLLRQYRRIQDPVFRTFGGLAMGLLAIPEARPLLEERFATDADASLPLRLLGDRDVVMALLGRVEDHDLARAIEAVKALGHTLSPEAIGPLAKVAANVTLDPALRAQAIASLGELADEDPVHWSSIYANDLQYHILTAALRSPSKDGLGLLDDRVVAVR